MWEPVNLTPPLSEQFSGLCVLVCVFLSLASCTVRRCPPFRLSLAPLQRRFRPSPSPRSCDHWLLFAVSNNQTRCAQQRGGSFEAWLIDCRRSCWHSFDRPAAVGGSDQWSTSSFMNDTFLPRWLDSFPLLASFLYPADPPPRSPFRFNNSLLVFFFIYIFYSLSAFRFSIFNFLFLIFLTFVFITTSYPLRSSFPSVFTDGSIISHVRAYIIVT